MIKLNLVICALFTFSSCKSENLEKESKNNTDNVEHTYVLENGAVVSLVVENNVAQGFVFLSDDFQFSIDFEKESIKSTHSFKKGNRILYDINGDFIPDYKFENGKKTPMKLLPSNLQ